MSWWEILGAIVLIVALGVARDWLGRHGWLRP